MNPPAINWNALALLWSMRRLIEELPTVEQERVHLAERELREILERYGEQATWAFALVAVEISNEP